MRFGVTCDNQARRRRDRTCLFHNPLVGAPRVAELPAARPRHRTGARLVFSLSGHFAVPDPTLTDLTMTAIEPGSAAPSTPTDVIGQLQQLRRDRADAAAAERAAASACYLSALQHKADPNSVAPPDVGELDRALAALATDEAFLAIDASSFCQIAALRKRDVAAAEATLTDVVLAGDRQLDEAHALRQRAEALEAEVQADRTKAERAVEACRRANEQGDRLAERLLAALAERGVQGADALAMLHPSVESAQQNGGTLRKFRALVDHFDAGRLRERGTTFLAHLSENEAANRTRDGKIELVEPESAGRQFDGPDPTPKRKGDDPGVDLRTAPFTTEGYVAREAALAEQRRRDQAAAAAAVEQEASQ